MADSRTSHKAARTHVSERPDPIVLREVDPASRGRGNGKPAGFWYQVNGDWQRWCEGEEFGLDRLLHLHTVDLADCKVLRITKVAAFDNFARFYGTGRIDYAGHHDAIDWGRVGRDFDALEIAPYIWARRLDGGIWYYGWDCASGVIWRPRGATVTYVGPLARVEVPA